MCYSTTFHGVLGYGNIWSLGNSGGDRVLVSIPRDSWQGSEPKTKNGSNTLQGDSAQLHVTVAALRVMMSLDSYVAGLCTSGSCKQKQAWQRGSVGAMAG